MTQPTRSARPRRHEHRHAVADADLVVLAVPVTALDSIAGELGDDLAGKVVVDVSNRPTPDPAGPGTSIAEELQDAAARRAAS